MKRNDLSNVIAKVEKQNFNKVKKGFYNALMAFLCFTAIALSSYLVYAEMQNTKHLQEIERYIKLEEQSNWVKAQIKLNQQKMEAEKKDTLNAHN